MKTITVKGTGRASARPDEIVISMNLESRDEVYAKAMEKAEESIDRLNRSLEDAGFEKDALKTTNFNVYTDYRSVHEEDGSYRNVFNGYVVNHALKLEFDFDSVRLGEALAAVGACPAHPQISVAFTVKDPAGISEEMLRSAAEDAKRKAEILCEASGVTLGELINVNYSWGELDVFSRTQYDMAEECMEAPMMAKCANIAIEPMDIETSDTATFVWEIR